MKPMLSLSMLALIAGCAQLADRFRSAPQAPDIGPEIVAPPAEAAAVVVAPPPPPAARTAEALDTTTAAQKAAAAEGPVAGETRLGETVASLGDPTEPGLWIKTPLTREPGVGRLEYQGRSAKVQLIPVEGAATGGSQVSLSAMRLLEAPLTDLPTITVFEG